MPQTSSEVTLSEAISNSERAVLTEECLKLETMVIKLSEEIKWKDQEASNLGKKIVTFKESENVCLNEQFKQGIETKAATIFPGKHNATKAMILMDI